MSNNNKTLVSLIIPCRNEERYIGRCIESLLECKIDNGSTEIIIADGQSTDKSLDIIKNKICENANIRLIENKETFTANGLNLGIKNALGNYILIASSHSEYEKNYISTLLKEMEELDADVIGGIMTTKVMHSTKTSEAIRIALTNKFGVGNSLFRTGISKAQAVDTVPFGLYKKSFFDEVGTYNEKLIRNHDIELSKRALSAKKKIFLTPSVSCTYYARETYLALAKNNFRNGLWNIKTFFITKTLYSLSLRHFIPLIFLLSIIAPIMPAFLWSAKFIYISAFSIFTYIVFLFFVSIKSKNKKTNIFHIIWAFVTLHISYGSGSIYGFFK